MSGRTIVGQSLAAGGFLSEAKQPREGEKQTFFGAALVPLRSLPPEPVYVLQSRCIRCDGIAGIKEHPQCVSFIHIILVSAREADRVRAVFSWSDSGDPRPRGTGIR